MKKRLSLAILAVILFTISLICYAGGPTTSGTTVNGIVTLARYTLREATASFWSDAELISHVNSAIREIVEKTHCLQSVEQKTLSSATTEYALSSSYVVVDLILYQSGTTAYKRLTKRDPIYGKIDLDLTEPEFWYEAGGKIGIYPVGTTASGNTAVIYYIPLQSTLSGASSVPTPASLDDAVVYYTLAQALPKQQKFDVAAYYLGLFRQEIMEYRQDIVYPKPETVEEKTK